MVSILKNITLLTFSYLSLAQNQQELGAIQQDIHKLQSEMYGYGEGVGGGFGYSGGLQTSTEYYPPSPSGIIRVAMKNRIDAGTQVHIPYHPKSTELVQFIRTADAPTPEELEELEDMVYLYRDSPRMQKLLYDIYQSSREQTKSQAQSLLLQRDPQKLARYSQEMKDHYDLLTSGEPNDKSTQLPKLPELPRGYIREPNFSSYEEDLIKPIESTLAQLLPKVKKYIDCMKKLNPNNDFMPDLETEQCDLIGLVDETWDDICKLSELQAGTNLRVFVCQVAPKSQSGKLLSDYELNSAGSCLVHERVDILAELMMDESINPNGVLPDSYLKISKSNCHLGFQSLKKKIDTSDKLQRATILFGQYCEEANNYSISLENFFNENLLNEKFQEREEKQREAVNELALLSESLIKMGGGLATIGLRDVSSLMYGANTCLGFISGKTWLQENIGLYEALYNHSHENCAHNHHSAYGAMSPEQMRNLQMKILEEARNSKEGIESLAQDLNYGISKDITKLISRIFATHLSEVPLSSLLESERQEYEHLQRQLQNGEIDDRDYYPRSLKLNRDVVRRIAAEEIVFSRFSEIVETATATNPVIKATDVVLTEANWNFSDDGKLEKINVRWETQVKTNNGTTVTVPGQFPLKPVASSRQNY